MKTLKKLNEKYKIQSRIKSNKLLLIKNIYFIKEKMKKSRRK